MYKDETNVYRMTKEDMEKMYRNMKRSKPVKEEISKIEKIKAGIKYTIKYIFGLVVIGNAALFVIGAGNTIRERYLDKLPEDQKGKIVSMVESGEIGKNDFFQLNEKLLKLEDSLVKAQEYLSEGKPYEVIAIMEKAKAIVAVLEKSKMTDIMNFTPIKNQIGEIEKSTADLIKQMEATAKST